MPLQPSPLHVTWQPAAQARTADAAALANLLRSSRARTLGLIDCYEAALGPDLRVPLHAQFNPPLWELGHVGWFQDYWVGRNTQRAGGTAYDHSIAPATPATVAPGINADSLYDSSLVAHDSRWNLPLPSLDATRAQLHAGLLHTLDLLAGSPRDDAALYFYRLALFHEDMHGEAAVYMAQALGIPVDPALLLMPVHARTSQTGALQVPACTWRLGSTGAGFVFDNERVGHDVALPAFAIDRSAVSWRRFLPFVESGGYANARWWSPEGWRWRTTLAQTLPRYLRADLHGVGWECQRFGQWQALDLDAAAVHLSFFEAQAWCQWAGLQLPTEAQWECAALTQPDFCWGEVWEWMASPFVPYPGFVAHPYQDYSAPWFGSRPVLRGASEATADRMVHPRYRNYFTPERNDVHAGFRACTIGEISG
jgi:iron(II)-dependent oxidoreductase